MRQLRIILLVLFGSTCNACMFVGDDNVELSLGKDYYLVQSFDRIDLIKKELNAQTNNVLIEEIDSIGFNNDFIFGHSVNNYFLVYKDQNISPGIYTSFGEYYRELRKFELETVVLEPVSKLDF